MRDVAAQIGAARLSYALVHEGSGVGIMTDLDFRRRVATGEVGLAAPIAMLACAPVLTIAEDAIQAAALLNMIEHGVHHLVVADLAGRPIGVLRAVDLAGAEVRDPLLIGPAIEEARAVDELAAAGQLLPATLVEPGAGGLPATHIGAIHAAVVDAAVRCTCTHFPPSTACDTPGSCSARWPAGSRCCCPMWTLR
ncbi:CBS domain-containing protein [Dactylosporangium sp. CS-047395]|uniref:CBS domain-containing protein n=1 Tax=Dactylosporangium sp. CS-047395 TaxID=3239936 RepID=UPI003D906082